VRAEVSTEVHRQLDRLDDIDRQVVILRGIEQQSNATVGLLLEMEPKTVSKRYHRALDRLRALMPGSVFDEFDEDGQQDGDEPPDS
jgi:DNA-directed RNA polymerase specialized sigma24 family protein